MLYNRAEKEDNSLIFFNSLGLHIMYFLKLYLFAHVPKNYKMACIRLLGSF